MTITPAPGVLLVGIGGVVLVFARARGGSLMPLGRG